MRLTPLELSKSLPLTNSVTLTKIRATQFYHLLSRRGENMKLKIVMLALVVFFAGTVVTSAQSPHMGTWKLNEAKSKLPKGATKNQTVVYEAAGDQIKVTLDGVDASGSAIH